MPPENEGNNSGKRAIKRVQLARSEPHTDPKPLETIAAPTRVFAGAHDMIRDQHTLEIRHHLPNSSGTVVHEPIGECPYHPSRFPFDGQLSDPGSVAQRPAMSACDCGWTTLSQQSTRMRHEHHIHPAGLMAPDALSEFILISGAVIFVGLLFALFRILLQGAPAFG